MRDGGVCPKKAYYCEFTVIATGLISQAKYTNMGEVSHSNY